MKMALQILTTFFLAYWPIVAMTSVMAFDAPGSTDNKDAIFLALGAMFYPVVFGVYFYFLNQSFWGIAPKKFLVLCIVVPFLASLVFGYPQLLWNSIRGVSSNSYFQKAEAVYFDGSKFQADSKSFEIINQLDGYARDKDHVYYRGQVVEAADPASFVEVEKDSVYYKDKTSVYFHGTKLLGSDSASFVQLKKDNEATTFYKDKNAVYWMAKVIPGLEAISVELVGNGFLTDKKAVFYYDKKLNNADPASFRSIENTESWAKDKTSAYFREFEFRNLHIDTLQILERGYLKDKDHVYYLDQNKLNLVEGADSNSFKVTNWDNDTKSEAKDANRFYSEGKQVK